MDINNLPEKEKKKIEVVKAAFAGDLDLLKTLRKMVLGFPLTAYEKDRSKIITDNPQLIEIIESNLNPTLTGDEEIFMINDIWFQLNIKDKSKEEALLLMKAVALNQKFMTQAIIRVKGGESDYNINALSYDENLSDDENLYRTISRNITISGVEGCLRGFFNLAGEKGETIEQLAKRMEKNSSK